ncbi:MAG: phosphatidylserine/phosphatidylglycerophosphate/cardiolipin synthase family protein [Candidatus Liptonbacteria bacterium]|nr:phosphatidylserine/phosphatidylglycerophosphate/cardiolipin synthase family protein [Candidatus Liptonbacteria bacterium]
MVQIRVFHHGKAFYKCLEDELRGAKKEILLNVYSFHDDSIGKKLLAVLKEKAKEGVAIKIILDGLGSRHDGREIAMELEATGIDLKIFRPRSYYLYHHPVFFLRRDHARIFLIDRKLLGLGGICIGEIYNERQDLSVLLEISYADPIVSFFEYLWALADRNDVPLVFQENYPHLHPLSSDISALISTPIKREQSIRRWYLDRIKNAKRRIVVVSTWFLPARDLLRELMAAKARGVHVAIATPFHTDKRWYDYFRGSAIPQLLYKNVEWYGIKEYFHQKFSVIDDDWCLGSANFDMISMDRNYELNICGHGGPVLGELENNFKKMVSEGESITRTRMARIMRRIGKVVYPLLEFFMVAN